MMSLIKNTCCRSRGLISQILFFKCETELFLILAPGVQAQRAQRAYNYPGKMLM